MMNIIYRQYVKLLFTVLMALSLSAFAATPNNLEAWSDWVLHDVPEHNCPQLEKNYLCQWTQGLDISINKNHLVWQQKWQIYAKTWVTLLGDSKYFPQNVQLERLEQDFNHKQAALIMLRGTRPSVLLEPGTYILSGELNWQRRPEFIRIAEETGLIYLEIDGEIITNPNLDNQGRLWLQRPVITTANESDRREIRVYRRIIDDNPLYVHTHIELDIAGQHREEILAPALLADQIPLELNSPLPARLESNGQLRIQVRPGNWVINLVTRSSGIVDNLVLPQPQTWAQEEVWVFDARNDLRWVEVQNVDSIDPRQTNLPSEWRNLPSYRMTPGATMKFMTKRRGNPEPEPDKLILHRNFWLDFNGEGYSIQDKINGQINRSWRLEMAKGDLGMVSIDGDNQFITKLDDSHTGVEVRQGNINLIADSRLVGMTNKFTFCVHCFALALPAVGWAHDFQQVSATLHLPPGWRLLAADGVDSIYPTWINQWTLLDIFLILIIAMAGAKLWRWYWGVLLLITLVLIYHEPQAPRYVWLNLLAAIALLRVLPAMSFWAWAAGWYRNLSLLALIIITVPFMAQQISQSLFPQLEHRGALAPTGTTAMIQHAELDVMQDSNFDEQELQEISPARAYKYPAPELLSAPSPKKMQLDPKAQVQTGPGLPHWDWQRVELQWSGPVKAQQELSIWVLPPYLNQILGLVQILLLALLVGLLAKVSFKPYKLPAASATIWTLFCAHILATLLGSSLISPAQAQDTYPPPQLLETLKQRLLEPAACAPHCANIPRMFLQLEENYLSLRLEAHILADTVIPLPGQANQWLPETVFVNGERAKTLRRDKQGYLWLHLNAGIHQLQLNGRLAERNTIQLALPLKPQRIETKIEAWQVNGIHEHGWADSQLQFTRQQQTFTPLEMGTLPPFLRIERVLSLGLDWQVETTVTRLSPLGSAVVAEIPLLPSEAVTSDAVRVQNNTVLLNLAAQESRINWTSVLDKNQRLELTAAHNIHSTEIWKLDASTIWHVTTEGIAPVHHQDRSGQWLPEWRPWAGEQVILHIERPQGVSGQSITIDETKLQVRPGQRETETTLSLRLRSSLGSQHQIKLPSDAQLEWVKIDGITQSIRQEQQIITLPIKPGEQYIQLMFRQAYGISNLFTIPSVDLGIANVNLHLSLELPYSRWLLWTDTKLIGPVVLAWGLLLVVILLAIGLSLIKLTPLGFIQWLLLGIILIQLPITNSIIVVIWLLALGWRGKYTNQISTLSTFSFNFMQLSLVGLSIAALAMLLLAVHEGLLGAPNMYVMGNASQAYQLNWYQDRSSNITPAVWVYSLPLWWYRIAMLLWALWLALSVLNWLRWGWDCFTTGGYWRNWHWPWRKVRS
jgi:hypothetical protein